MGKPYSSIKKIGRQTYGLRSYISLSPILNLPVRSPNRLISPSMSDGNEAKKPREVVVPVDVRGEHVGPIHRQQVRHQRGVIIEHGGIHAPELITERILEFLGRRLRNIWTLRAMTCVSKGQEAPSAVFTALRTGWRMSYWKISLKLSRGRANATIENREAPCIPTIPPRKTAGDHASRPADSFPFRTTV